ncbi:LacI family DNA-binding transcriptional regulator [Nocardioides sp. Kera G14]|uniref:LacI family DNA-binding transcriptional regulator n=1 Tax=Nocardioides sp. Kera G14 TaxID=2884264 RepID=UPI001D10158A|nr:LacI family DNA-binding transcriptional regulator [Nocardioides sp. Kera G14]UDY23470.1 LacI family transcriptional regulator [Nocardioides sp. Kera G14]
MAGRVSMRDVAAASGVSPATVSFVLNNVAGQTISPTTRKRVEEAARSLGYVPHGIARALREGSSRIVVLNIGQNLEGNYSQTYVRGLGDELARHEHVLLVQHQELTDDSLKQIQDAVSPRAVIRFAQRYLTGHELDDGGWQSGLASHTAAQIGHLAERGHTRIAMAIPEDRPPLSTVRLHFAEETARNLGLAPLQPFFIPASRRDAARALEELLAENGSITAVAGFVDETALRTVKAALDLGLRVPEDLAVIGYDATPYGELATPALSTVHIDAEAHGRHTARSVLGLAVDDLVTQTAHVIQREST